jgi:hypothetical protein
LDDTLDYRTARASVADNSRELRFAPEFRHT